MPAAEARESVSRGFCNYLKGPPLLFRVSGGSLNLGAED